MNQTTVTLTDEQWDAILYVLHKLRNSGDVEAQRAHATLRKAVADEQ